MRLVLSISLLVALLISCGKTVVSDLEGEVSSKGSEIVKGEMVIAGDPIFNVSVSINKEYDRPFCSGFLFNKRVVVTAAHCLLGNNKIQSVTFGNPLSLKSKTYKVSQDKIFPHEDFEFERNPSPNPYYPPKDIGLIILDKDAPEFTKTMYVKEIGYVNSGDEVLISGYGATMNANEFSGELRKASSKIHYINTNSEEIIIKASDGSGSCYGDSGGPLFYKENDGSYTIIGVTSRAYDFDENCGGRGIYTDIRKQLRWIEKKMQENL